MVQSGLHFCRQLAACGGLAALLLAGWAHGASAVGSTTITLRIAPRISVSPIGPIELDAVAHSSDLRGSARLCVRGAHNQPYAIAVLGAANATQNRSRVTATAQTVAIADDRTGSGCSAAQGFDSALSFRLAREQQHNTLSAPETITFLVSAE